MHTCCGIQLEVAVWEWRLHTAAKGGICKIRIQILSVDRPGVKVFRSIGPRFTWSISVTIRHLLNYTGH